jgi:hypothetical protein
MRVSRMYCMRNLCQDQGTSLSLPALLAACEAEGIEAELARLAVQTHRRLPNGRTRDHCQATGGGM